MFEPFQNTQRERQAATETFKQNDARFLLQPITLSPKGRLRHAQSMRGGRRTVPQL